MALSPWLSSIASWKKPSSSRFKASPIVHTAPEKENSRHKRSRKLSLDRLQRPTLNLHTTERNHYTGPHSAAKVDHFFAASDTSHHCNKIRYQIYETAYIVGVKVWQRGRLARINLEKGGCCSVVRANRRNFTCLLSSAGRCRP